jgi:hypothetical protein
LEYSKDSRPEIPGSQKTAAQMQKPTVRIQGMLSHIAICPLDEAIETTKDLIEESWDWERILEVPAIKSAIIFIYMCL